MSVGKNSMKKWIDKLRSVDNIVLTIMVPILLGMGVAQAKLTALVSGMQDDQKIIAAAVTANQQNIRTIAVSTMIRTDPWSGRMMVAAFDRVSSELKREGVDIDVFWTDVIREIQTEYAPELLPDEIKELLK